MLELEYRENLKFSEIYSWVFKSLLRYVVISIRKVVIKSKTENSGSNPYSHNVEFLIMWIKTSLLLFSAVTSRREYLIFFNRVAIIIIFLYSGIIDLSSFYILGIGIYNGLFHSTEIVQIFGLFMYIIGAIISLLTAFNPRRDTILGKNAPQLTLLEFPQLSLFVLIGAVLLISTNIGYITSLDTEIGIYNGLFHSITQNFNPYLLSIVPILPYSNADTMKTEILNENRNKIGIYRWINLLNGKSYVGSGVNLSHRLKLYYSLRSMNAQLKRGKSAIYSSILKHGHSSFSLEILEFCEPIMLWQENSIILTYWSLNIIS